MELRDKIRRTSNSDNGAAPFRQSGAGRNTFVQPTNKPRPNRQAPRSVQYQPENEETDYGYQENGQQNTYATPNAETYFPNPTEFPATHIPMHDGVYSQYTDIAMSQLPPQNTVPPIAPPPQQHAIHDNLVSSQSSNQNPNLGFNNTSETAVSAQNPKDLELQFLNSVTTLFKIYEIDKVLIVGNKIYTVNFIGDNNSEVFDETLDENLVKKFAETFVTDGYYETLLSDGIKLEMVYQPIAQAPTIIASKTNTDFFVDEEFVSIVFEFLTKGKNIVMLSPVVTETLFKIVADFFDNNLCVTINEPIKTNNNVTFKENPLKPSLKTVLSIADKIEPDNTLIYMPYDMLSSLSYMRTNNNVALFSNTANASDFVNADAIHALGGTSEYNRVSILKAVDIIFTVTFTKNNKVKYTATQLLSPTNKSHINKIKRIIGDAEIDMNKIYLSNVFEKEIEQTANHL